MFSIHFNESISAQNCKELDDWSLQVLNEFPDLNLNSLRSGSKEYNRIRFNLLSDKYFIPVFGKSFGDLGQPKRKSIHSKLIRCKNNEKYPNAAWLDFLLWGTFSQEWVYEKAVEEIRSLRNQRLEYEKVFKNIESGQVSFEKLSEYKRLSLSNFPKLLPSEINSLTNLISKSEINIANQELISNAEKVANLETKYSSLEQLLSFRQRNYRMYSLANDDIKRRANEVVEKKIKSILQTIVPDEKQRLVLITESEEGVFQINDFYREFNQRYAMVSEYGEIKEVANLILQKKTEIILGKAQQIKLKIKNANNVEDIQNIESIYLSYVNSKNSTISQLKNLSSNRKEEIIEEERSVKLAKIEEEKRKEKELALNQLKLLAKGGYSNFTETQYSLLKDDFSYSKSTNKDILELVEAMNSKNGVYLIDVDRSTCAKILNVESQNEYVEFETVLSKRSKIYKKSGTVEYLYDIEAGMKIVSYSAYQRALGCYNIQEYLKPDLRIFAINKVYKHNELNFTTQWNTETKKRFCSTRAFYDDCRSECWRTVEYGDSNYLFIRSKGIAKTYINGGQCYE